jgi:flagellar biosynthesis protein FlhF
MATATQHATLKTYHGPSMAEALAKVKNDLGADAVILHTRTFKVGGVLGVGTRDMVEITASADAGIVRPRQIRPRPEGGFDAGLATAAATPSLPIETGTLRGGVVDDRPGFIPTPPWFKPAEPAQPETPDVGRPVASGNARGARQMVEAKPSPDSPESGELRRAIAEQQLSLSTTGERTRPASLVDDHRPDSRVETPAEPPRPVRLSAVRVTPAPTTPVAQAALEEELAAIRRLVGQVLQSSRRAEVRAVQTTETAPADGAAVSTGPAFDLYLRLLDNQASTEVADELTSAVRDELTAGELGDAGVVRETMLRHLSKRIPVAVDTQPPTRTVAGRPSVVALVGPTGVGKTTTVAKLAANYKLRYGRKVGLVTADTYRIAAVEQLRTYAEIVGLPLKIALSPQDMTAAIESLSDCDVVIVDTAGRSQHDTSRIDELGEMLEAAQPDTTHLVLSLAAAESVIHAAAERFAGLKPDRLILSKLDEVVDFGVIANIAARTGLRFSYLTTGQEVPDHIEPASADRLARLVLDGQAAWKVSSRGG